MPISDTTPNQWDVVVVPFPYSDQLAEKRRPALVVSGRAFNRETNLLWVMMITTSRADWPGDISIDNLATAGLPVPSKVRTAKIATIEAARIMRIAGSLGAKEAQQVTSRLGAIVSADGH